MENGIERVIKLDFKISHYAYLGLYSLFNHQHEN